MLEIEIFSDVICPWCFIGKRRLDQTLQGELGEGVALRWRPYQLRPGLPSQGIDRLGYLQQRYGADADPGKLPERIRQEAEAEGIELRYDLMQRIPNTLLAHRLMEFAGEVGLQHELAERLFLAYFCEGVDVGDLESLLVQASAVGLKATQARLWLQDGGGIEAVEHQLQRAPELGISGLPGYYLANSFLLPGAQTAEVMAQIIARVKTKLAS